MKDKLNDMANEYADSLQKSQKNIVKPSMPKHDVTAYTDYEYLSALKELYCSMQELDSLEQTEKFLKGDKC